MFSRESPACHSGFLATNPVVLHNFRFTENSVSMTTLSQASSPAARSSAVPQELFHMQAKNLVPLSRRQLAIFLLKKAMPRTSELNNSFPAKVISSPSTPRFKPWEPSSVAKFKHLFFLFKPRCFQSTKH